VGVEQCQRQEGDRWCVLHELGALSLVRWGVGTG
jgi:hypothetical protein